MPIPEPQQPASTQGAGQGPGNTREDRARPLPEVHRPGHHRAIPGACLIPGHDTVFVAADAGPVTNDTGRCQLTATATLAELTAPDVVIIGGSVSDEDPDQRVVQCLRQVHPVSTWTASVCTGSIYLAAAGILAGQEATLGTRRTARTPGRPLYRAAGGRTRKGDRRGRRISGHRRGPHPARPHARPGACADGPARHRIRPPPALRRRITVESAGRDGGFPAITAEHPRSACPTGRALRRPAAEPGGKQLHCGPQA